MMDMSNANEKVMKEKKRMVMMVGMAIEFDAIDGVWMVREREREGC